MNSSHGTLSSLLGMAANGLSRRRYIRTCENMTKWKSYLSSPDIRGKRAALCNSQKNWASYMYNSEAYYNTRYCNISDWPLTGSLNLNT